MILTCTGFKEPENLRWERMQKAYQACKEAEIKIPEEIEQFLQYEKMGEPVDISMAVVEWKGAAPKGIYVDLLKLPEDIRYIRVVC